MKEVRKAKHYYRYCDDIIILSKSKSELHAYRRFIIDEMTKLGLSIKNNHQVYEVNDSRGVDFLGVVTFKNKVNIRKSIVKSFKRLTRTVNTHNAKSIISYYGWVKHTKSYSLWCKYVSIYLNGLMTRFGKVIYTIKEIQTLRGLTC